MKAFHYRKISLIFTKETVMQEMRDKKDIEHIEDKSQNDRSESFLSTRTLNVDWLNSPIKRQRLEECVNKQSQPTAVTRDSF